MATFELAGESPEAIATRWVRLHEGPSGQWFEVVIESPDRNLAPVIVFNLSGVPGHRARNLEAAERELADWRAIVARIVQDARGENQTAPE